MTHYVYVIRSLAHNRLYVGMSVNVSRRIQEHNMGYVISTKPYKPWKLFYSEKCASRKAARIREKYWKSGYGKERLKNIPR